MVLRKLDVVPSKNKTRLVKWSAAPLNLLEQEPRSYSWPEPFQLDQEEEGACVGHGLAEEAVNKPDIVDLRIQPTPEDFRRFQQLQSAGASLQEVTQAFAFELYYWTKKWDQWAGEDYDGTSMDAGADRMKALQIWPEYRWGSWAEARVFIGRHGPITVACPWKTKMFKPSPSGYLEVSGRTEGWHCVMFNRFSIKRGGAYTPNSWGGHGAGWISDEGMFQLESEGAEFCLPVRRARKDRV